MHRFRSTAVVGLRINTNVLSITAQRNLGNTAKAFGRALERLASGSRINRAGDDPAGLAIGEGLKSQITALSRGVRNINDAMGILSTADGALGIQTDIVQRMRELALQSANGTLAEKDRSHLETEFQQLVEEFNRVATATDFNGNRLLNGSFQTMSVQVGANKGETIGLSLEGSMLADIFETSSTTEEQVVGDGAFAGETFYNISGIGQKHGVALGDFDNDGNLDSLFTQDSATGVTISALGDGNGSFTSSTQEGTQGRTGDERVAVLGDFDQDGNLDFAVTHELFSYFEVQLGQGDGTFDFLATFETTVSSGWGIDIGDFNEDGDLDIVVAGQFGSDIETFLGGGTGNFASNATFDASDLSRGIHVVDVNGDNHDDFVTENSDGEINIFTGDGAGDFTLSQIIDTGGGDHSRATVGDLNGDGDMDLFFTDSQLGEGYVWLGNGNGTFSFEQTISTGVDSERNVGGDIDGDGDIDIVIGADTEQLVMTLINAGDGTFSVGATYSASAQVNDVDLGDMNNDGVLDIVAGVGTDAAIFLGTSETTTVTVESVGVADLTIATQADAQDVLEILDTGIQGLLERRASIGAQQNRLDSAANNASIMVENLAQAKSQILDTDIAAETAELTRAQILQQAGVSVLGQANTSLRIVLELLRF